MSLLSRVIRLESRARYPAKPVHVVFHNIGESGKELVLRTRAENHDPEAIFILVKFVEPIQFSPNGNQQHVIGRSVLSDR